jgi:hypothetical protein
MLDGNEFKKWVFLYSGSVLDRIEMYYGDRLNNVQHFNEKGLLKFTREMPKPGYKEDTLYHSYIYY